MKIEQKYIDRFWSKVDRSGDCWEWMAGKFNSGYGAFGISRKNRGAHRVAWTLTNNPIPPGMCVCHTCDNPGCCNPGHLFLGTNADNTRDRYKKGRSAKGESHGNSKLTEKQVLEIRTKYIPCEYSQRKLAKEYGVAQRLIHNIIHRKIWSHI